MSVNRLATGAPQAPRRSERRGTAVALLEMLVDEDSGPGTPRSYRARGAVSTRALVTAVVYARPR